MLLRVRLIFSSFLLIALCAGLASAQSSFNFQLFVTTNGISNTVGNNTAGIPIIAQVGQSAQATVVATYLGPTQVTIPASTPPPPQVLGTPEITAKITSTNTGSAALPIMLSPGGQFTFVVTFAPTSTQQAVAQVTIPYVEEGTNAMPVNGAIILGFQGETPQATLSYAVQPNNVVTAIQSGGTITFPPTPLNTTATAVFLISDTGTAPEMIIGITGPPADSPFKLVNLGCLATPQNPCTLPPNGGASSTLQFGIQYTPTKAGTDTAPISVTFQGGITDTINLSGTGATSSFSYAYLVNGTSTPVSPQQTITFPPAAVATATTPAGTSSVIVQVTNKGSVTGTINGISVSPPFAVVTPPSNSLTLLPGGITSFTISYTPTLVGTQTGSLVIGNDIFTLSGQGLGPSLTFSFTTSGGSIIPIGPTGAMVFAPKPVTESETLNFTLTNSGTTDATVSNISTSSSTTPNEFSVSPPALPLVLRAGQSVQFPVTFTPALAATVIGTLQIDTTAVPLLGTGTAPPAMPSYTLSGPSGNVSPASQANVSLTLANTYPADLQGVLTLTTSGNDGTDPAVQFETGSTPGNRTVDFTIPANTTSANFVGQGPNILVQTGTVAETVTLTPSFQTTAGIPLTPTSPPTLQFTIPAAAPVIESLTVTNQASSSFSLVVVGYTTTRSLSSMNVTFTPASGFTLTTSTFTIDVSGPSLIWFQSSASLGFGGQFQITVPFNLPGTPPKGQTLIQALASASVTVSNTVGASNALQSPIQ